MVDDRIAAVDQRVGNNAVMLEKPVGGGVDHLVFVVHTVLERRQVLHRQRLYQQSVSCMSGFLQEGAVQAFRIPDEVEAMRQSYQRRRDAFAGRLNAIPGVHCQMPEGAFYAWVSFDVDMTSDEMCDYILDHAKVVGVSGAAYGMTQGCFLRFSFASDDAALSVAADRIEAAMRAYQQR